MFVLETTSDTVYIHRKQTDKNLFVDPNAVLQIYLSQISVGQNSSYLKSLIKLVSENTDIL